MPSKTFDDRWVSFGAFEMYLTKKKGSRFTWISVFDIDHWGISSKIECEIEQNRLEWKSYWHTLYVNWLGVKMLGARYHENATHQSIFWNESKMFTAMHLHFHVFHISMVDKITAGEEGRRDRWTYTSWSVILYCLSPCRRTGIPAIVIDRRCRLDGSSWGTRIIARPVHRHSNTLCE